MSRRNIALLVLSVLALTLAAVPALAAKGGGGKVSVTIALGSTSRVAAGSGSATFSVARSGPSDDVFWVTNTCVDAAGAQVLKYDAPVVWGTWDSLAGSTTTPTAGVSCTAHVTLRPWTTSVLDNAIVTYTP